mgnify:CR=1 FL=1
MKLSTEQQSILEYSLTNEWDIIIINGPAGTGKTTLLNSIYQEYKIKHPNVILYPAAFTGRASAVLKDKGLDNARKIGTWTYIIDGKELDVKVEWTYFKEPTLKEGE